MKTHYNHSFHKRLLSYSAATGAFIALCPETRGQVEYTDINPDDTVMNATYNLDLNNDGTNDFRFEHKFFTTTWMGSTSTSATIQMSELNNGNGVLGGMSSAYVTPFKFNAGFYFTSGLVSWKSSFDDLCHLWRTVFGMGRGDWQGPVNQKFLGLKIEDGGETFYGWARISIMDGDTGFIIHDYAYEQTAGVSIAAGDTSGSSTSFKLPDYNTEISTYSFDKKLIVHSKDEADHWEIRIANMKGQEVYQDNCRTGRMEIDLNHLPAGIYVVDGKNSEGRFRRKIVL